MYLGVKSASPCPRNPFLFSWWIEKSESQANIPVLESIRHGERDAMRLSVEPPIVNQLIADADFFRLSTRAIYLKSRAVPPRLVGIFLYAAGNRHRVRRHLTS